MKIKISFIATIILLNSLLISTNTNAQSSKVWYKPKAYPESLALDWDSCKKINNDVSNCLIQRGWTLVDKNVLDSDIKQCQESAAGSKEVNSEGKTLYQTCMLDKGWDVQSEADRQLQILVKEIMKNCENPKYSELAKKTPCSSAEITLEQLADNSKITPTQKLAFQELTKTSDSINQKMDLIKSNGSMFMKKFYDYRLSTEIPKIDAYRLNLILGKTTWGEYNQKRKELYLINREKVKQISDEVNAFIKQSR
jgi:hypothetical protein